jgi:hypothetical protein
MVSARDGSTDAETAKSDGHSSPLPTLAQVLASICKSREEQTELLRLLVNNSNRDGAVVGNARDQARSSYVEFLPIHPPTFTEASEPLEADHWLHTVESKFDLLNCIENQKILFAAQQLLGDARPWWASFTATRPANQVQWAEFRDAFRAQHIPAGIMKTKHREFMHLQQGNQSVYVYSKMFNHLAQYAPEQVDTDEKKEYCFMKGFSTKLQEHLALNADWTFLELVSNAIIADDAIHTYRESKKKKALAAPASSAPHKYHMLCAPHHHPPLQHHYQLATCPPPHRNIVPRAMAPPPTVSQPPPQKMGVVPRTCYNCGQVGHIVRDCTALMRTSGPHPRSHCNQSPQGPMKVVATRTGRVNYTTIKDVPKGERILAGTFSLNGHPVVILFDSGASHDFINKACTQKCQLVIEHMSTPYMILTPGGNIITKQLVINAPLNLGGKVYKMHLIVLDGQGIDVILGMNWMRDHKVLLDTASRTM